MFSYEFIIYFFAAITCAVFVAKANGGSFFKNPFSYVAVLLSVFVNVSAYVFNQNAILALLVNAVIFVLYSLTLKGKLFKCIVTAVIPVVLMGGLGILFLWFMAYISGLEVWECFEKDSYTRSTVIGFVPFLSALILVIIASFIRDKSKRRFQEYFLLVISPALMFIVLMIILKLSTLSDMKEYRYLFIIAVAAVITIYIGIYYLVYRVTKSLRIEEEKELFKRTVEAQKQRYSDINDSLERIERVRHDIKNQLNVVSLLISEKRYVEAKATLDTISSSVYTSGTIITDGDPVADYIINVKLGSLKDTVIVVSGDSTRLNFVDSLDLSIMLGCILDNAVEAIKNQSKPHVELHFFEKAGNISVICKNSIEASVLKDNPSLKTTKQAGHGFGIRTVREISEKYNGMMTVYEEFEMFCIQILLPIPN